MIDFTDYCKICGLSPEESDSNSSPFYSLFERNTESDESILTKDGLMFADCIVQQIVPSTNYPEYVCEICHIKLCDFTEFREIALATHSRITELINKSDESNVIKEEHDVDLSDDEGDSDSHNSMIVSDSIAVEDNTDNLNKLDPDVSNETYINLARKNFRCKVCLIVFEDGTLLQKHMKDHQICEICFKMFNKKRQLDIHMSTEHEIPLARPRKRWTIRKKNQHDNNRSVSQEENIDITTSNMIKWFNQEKLLKCEQEGPADITYDFMYDEYDTANSENIQVPKKTYPANSKYRCNYCVVGYDSYTVLKEHVKSHLTCLICGRRYVLKRYLDAHVKSHGKVKISNNHRPKKKSYVCTTCGKECASIFILREHEFRHKDERPIKCETCGKMFKLTKDLLIHNRTHTGERNYVCDVCGKSFYENRHLVAHKECHSLVSLYECKICFRKLKTRSTLKSHMEQRHKYSGKYQCVYCNCLFGFRNRLIRHMKNHVRKGIFRLDEMEDYIKVNKVEPT